uniref:F-box domain-containing protein n=1 Tax=Pithovirus LCDPAC02 TaxID=2506601 RepID=A0A481YQB0_9VIRU|nr:MAG: hypothetical protein LCDPAC02_01640 [Pithovirus LCDPAC02]
MNLFEYLDNPTLHKIFSHLNFKTKKELRLTDTRFYDNIYLNYKPNIEKLSYYFYFCGNLISISEYNFDKIYLNYKEYLKLNKDMTNYKEYKKHLFELVKDGTKRKDSNTKLIFENIDEYEIEDIVKYKYLQNFHYYLDLFPLYDYIVKHNLNIEDLVNKYNKFDFLVLSFIFLIKDKLPIDKFKDILSIFENKYKNIEEFDKKFIKIQIKLKFIEICKIFIQNKDIFDKTKMFLKYSKTINAQLQVCHIYECKHNKPVNYLGESKRGKCYHEDFISSGHIYLCGTKKYRLKRSLYRESKFERNRYIFSYILQILDLCFNEYDEFEFNIFILLILKLYRQKNGRQNHLNFIFKYINKYINEYDNHYVNKYLMNTCSDVSNIERVMRNGHCYLEETLSISKNIISKIVPLHEKWLYIFNNLDFSSDITKEKVEYFKTLQNVINNFEKRTYSKHEDYIYINYSEESDNFNYDISESEEQYSLKK